MGDKWQVLATVSTRFEAEVMVARLGDSGIPAMTRADDVGGWVPELLQMKGVAVLVAGTQLEAAEALLLGSSPGEVAE